MAIWSARDDVREVRTVPVPRHLQDAHYPGSEVLGAGQDYEYPHDHPEGIVVNQYMGVDKEYYAPTRRGYEVRLAEYLEAVKALRRREGGAPEGGH